MPDPDDSPPLNSSGAEFDYRIREGIATPSLRARIQAEIAATGPMPVSRYMEIALYDPEAGYYATGVGRVGRGGDFFTSVSVGPLFGELLARRFAREFEAMGAPGRWRIVELGANDGALAGDILDALRREYPAAWHALEYVICEPLPVLRRLQAARLARHAERVRVVAGPSELHGDARPGIAFGNELLDALPFRRIEWRNGSWWEIGVGLGADGRLVTLSLGRAADELIVRAMSTGHRFPNGWCGEVRFGEQGLIGELLPILMDPLLIWIDYGFAENELYHPDRVDGTWRSYRDHRIEPAPWDHPGVCDLTAHVDFSAVADAARALGGRVIGFESQGTWLTRVAAALLAGRDGHVDPGWVRQFQTLTHPAHLGARFQVIELSWRAGAEDCPLALARLGRPATP